MAPITARNSYRRPESNPLAWKSQPVSSVKNSRRRRYEAERARRQYDAVEPENRLVARSLERAWEDKLRAVEPSNKNINVGVPKSRSS
jgi:hypothetical protein